MKSSSAKIQKEIIKSTERTLVRVSMCVSRCVYLCVSVLSLKVWTAKGGKINR